MKRALTGLVVACGVALGACGGDDGERAGENATTAATATAPAATTPEQQIDIAAPVSLPPAERERFVAGRDVAERAGCLACHRIGMAGNDGPGSNLTGIGERMPESAIRRSLVDPEPPMPSYDELPADELGALVAFLAALRDSSCPEDRDCG